MGQDMMGDVYFLLAAMRRREPFALARFGDGEVRAMRGQSLPQLAFTTDRAGLAEALEAALVADAPNYWVGLPCAVCQKDGHEFLTRKPIKARRTSAVVITNRNHEYFQGEFPSVARSFPDIYWFGAPGHRVLKLPFRATHRQVAARNAHLHIPAPDNLTRGALVLLACGFLGAILPSVWARERPDLTIVDIGAVYDPLVVGRATRRIFRGTLPPCTGCN